MLYKRNKSSALAVTLIEVLVATFILMIIVLILSKVFHQASITWSAGFRRAEGNMTGRSSVGFMARELMNATADPVYLWEGGVWNGAQSIRFISLTGEVDTQDRAARKITYAHSPAGSLTRTEEKPVAGGNYGSDWELVSEWVLVTNVVRVQFYTPDGANYVGGKMPEWVRMRLTLNRSDDVSGVGASSLGPDGVDNTPDDIASW